MAATGANPRRGSRVHGTLLQIVGQTMVDLGAQEQTVTVTLDHAALQAFREKFPAWMDADAFELL